MKKLSELTKAIRVIGGIMGLQAGPGSDLENLWLVVKRAAESTEPASIAQQLKAEISLGVGSIARDSSIPAVDRLDKIVMFVNEKLSAV